MDYLAVRLLEGVMSEAESMWDAVSAEAGLTSKEQAWLALAVEADEGLGEELTYLLRHLRADLSASFLRAFVDRLARDAEHVDSAAFAVQPALQSVLIPPPQAPEDRRA